MLCPFCSTFAFMTKEEILQQLNEGQRRAVEYCEGPQLVIAGAGSGKTRVLTYKIAYLLESGYKPWNILALTFTNKAAREMQARIGRLVGQERARYLAMGTFHSIFSRILRVEASMMGYQSNFTIYDQSDSLSLVKTIIKEMGLADKDDKLYKPSYIQERISNAKNHLILASQYGTSAMSQEDAQMKRPEVTHIYERYTERCRQANAMDFDDLLVNTFRLLNEHEEVRRKYMEIYQYVLVDEYQDTNRVQQQIVTLLTKENQRICVVGDDAQSIYSFRGANIDNILNFTSSYTDTRQFKLEQNYRSTQLIVQAANSLIKHNERQIPKDVFSKNEHGERLTLKPAYSDQEEAMIVCKDIVRIKRDDHCAYSDFAILYRTNAQSRSFEEQMRKMNIPYRIYGGLSFYQRKEIKDVIAYFRLVANPDDEEAFKRIINYPSRGIGDTTVAKIITAASTYGVSLWQVISQPALFQLAVNKGTLAKLESFRQLMQQWIDRAEADDAYTLGYDIITQSGISASIYSSREPDDLARQENLQEFIGGIQDFVESRREEDREQEVKISDFLQEVSLLTDFDSDGDDSLPKVSLMTVHSAKGLEFSTVFIVGMEENIFPSPMCVDSMRGLEEERRLLYVAITRAEKHCILTCAQSRYRYGKTEFDSPSRFLKDISPEFMQVDAGNMPAEESYRSSGYSSSYSSSFASSSRGSYARKSRAQGDYLQQRRPSPEVAPAIPAANFKPASRAIPSPSSAVASLSSFSTSSSDGLQPGCMIEHQRFGIGEVLNVEGVGENQKATVKFRNAGTKQLLLKFARFKKI